MASSIDLLEICVALRVHNISLFPLFVVALLYLRFFCDLDNGQDNDHRSLSGCRKRSVLAELGVRHRS